MTWQHGKREAFANTQPETITLDILVIIHALYRVRLNRKVLKEISFIEAKKMFANGDLQTDF